MSRVLSFVAASGAGLLAVVAYKKYRESQLRLPEGSHVVIVGAGYAGVSLADKLQGRGNYTLIDSRECLHHNMAALRGAVEPGFGRKLFIPYLPKYQDNFKQGKVTGIDTQNKSVTLEGHDSPIPYTHLVIATGSSGPFPGKCSIDTPVPKLIAKYENYASDISKANNIVIVGGGAVGVEMAAEVAHDYPGKSVTVVHNGETLVTKKLSADALQRIENRLKEMKIRVIMGDTVKNLSELTVNQFEEGMTAVTENGLNFKADMVIPCVGLKVNSDAYIDSIPQSVNSRGQLMVNDSLQVSGLDNVYAIGDCNDLPVDKLAKEASFQAFHLWKNLSSNKAPLPYQPGGFVMVVPLGREGGVVQIGKTVFGDWLAKRMKSRDVFVNFAWKAMGHPPPK